MCFIQKDNAEIIHYSKSVTRGVKSFYEQLYDSKEADILDEAILMKVRSSNTDKRKERWFRRAILYTRIFNTR